MSRSNESGYKVRGGIDSRSFWLATTPSPSQLQMPYVCTEAGTLYGGRPFLTERTCKESHLLFYTFGGAGVVSQGGRSVTVAHGQALLMDCRTQQSYGTSPKRGHWYHLWAHIEGSGVEATGRRLGLPKLVPISISASRIRPHFNALFERLRSESVENEELIGLAVHSLLSELVMAQARAAVPSDDPVRLACDYVAAHYAEQISVDDLARAASVSPSYLTRLFRQFMGTTPHDYLIRHRITRAKQLLMETYLPIGNIARMTGFATTSNFSYRFAKTCDITPRAYRNLRYGPSSSDGPTA